MNQIVSKLEFIKNKLNNKAYNTAQVSRLTGVTQAHLSKIASGGVKNPSYDMVEKIYQYFKGLK